MLGCEGGSSILDTDGTIQKNIIQYMKNHPKAKWAELKSEHLLDQDGNISCFAISPRHFECVMTGTCQILLEGNYENILEPGKHYIELKKDFRNISEVIQKVGDENYYSEIIKNCDRELIYSGKYSYKSYVEKILEHVPREKEIPCYPRIVFQLISLYLALRTPLNLLKIIFYKIQSKFTPHCNR